MNALYLFIYKMIIIVHMAPRNIHCCCLNLYPGIPHMYWVEVQANHVHLILFHSLVSVSLILKCLLSTISKSFLFLVLTSWTSSFLFGIGNSGCGLRLFSGLFWHSRRFLLNCVGGQYLVLIIFIFIIIWFIPKETCIIVVLILQAINLLRKHFRDCAGNFIQAFPSWSSTCLLLLSPLLSNSRLCSGF